MKCEEATVLLHALMDNELDAEHARAIEAHLTSCASCAARLRSYRIMHEALSAPALRHVAPELLRRRIDSLIPVPRDRAPDRRNLLKGFAMGSLVSAAAAASIVLFVRSGEQDQRILGDVVSAHLRSLQADHLTDVQSSNQHTVKPWFNGRLDVAPPVIDLTAVGFTLLGGRLDYVAGRAVAAIAYRRRTHVINLFVTQDFGHEPERGSKVETLQGFNIRQWSAAGLNFWAVSDISADELQEFGAKFERAAATNGG